MYSQREAGGTIDSRHGGLHAGDVGGEQEVVLGSGRHHAIPHDLNRHAYQHRINTMGASALLVICALDCTAVVMGEYRGWLCGDLGECSSPVMCMLYLVTCTCMPINADAVPLRRHRCVAIGLLHPIVFGVGVVCGGDE